MASSKTSLNCGICSNTFTKATMLECVHSFCRNCVESLIKDSKEKKIICPTCKAPSDIPKNGVEGLARNIRLDNLVKISSFRMKEDLDCQRCRRKMDRKAVEFCQQCNHLLCKACVDDHEIIADYDGHKRISIEEFKSGNAKIELPTGKCPLHNEAFRWYCLGHEHLLCETCRIEDHVKCENVLGLTRAAAREKDDLKKVKLRPAIDKLNSEIDACKEMREKVEASQVKVDQEIDQCFDILKQTLEERRVVLKKRCTEITQEKDKILADQLGETEKLHDEFIFLQDQVQDAITDHSLEELLSVKQVIKQRSNTRLEDFDLIDWTLKENEFIDMSIKEIDTIANNISSIGFFKEVPEPANCSVEGLNLHEAVVGFSREFKVIFKNEKNEVIKGKAMIQYTIEKAPGIPDPQDHSTCTQSNGMTTLSITPKAPGNLIITIMVRNTPLKGFPFNMKVRQPHGYNSGTLPNPKALNPLSSAGNCITISGDHIYVSTQNTVEVINSSGAQLKSHRKNLSNPWGVAVIEREVYISNRGTHDIHVFAIAGEYVRSFGGNGNANDQFNDPCGICSEGSDRILIADYGNKRVQVFSRTRANDGTTKETYLLSIPCSSNPIDVAVDASGKIHVALHPANQVEIFSWNGVAYQSVGRYNVGGTPTGVFVDASGYRFVTESTNNQLHVFDPSGRQVLPAKPGCSGGVAVDSNGTVYTNTPNSAQVNKF